MSDSAPSESSSGPKLTGDAHELQGSFPSDTAMQEALSKLTLLGFDHADFSLPDPNAPSGTPDDAVAATDEVDKTQMRTMASGMTGATAGVGIAGVLMATGGVAAPIVAAIAGASAIGGVAATSGAGVVADQADSSARDKLAAEGKLILAVRTRNAEMAQKAEAAMREAGATDVTSIADATKAKTRGVSSASWTGS